MNKNFIKAGKYALLAIIVIALGTAFLDQKPQSQQRWTYSKLINEVENNRVEIVQISADRTRARVTDFTGNPILVNLANDPELIDILMANNVDIAVLPESDQEVWFGILSSLFFPVLLLVGLFFLLRRA